MTTNFVVKEFTVGPVCTNCYIAKNQTTDEILIVDPGDEAELLKKQIKKLGGTPVAILLTHGHFDHAGAAAALKEAYGIDIYAYVEEQETLENPRLNLCGMVGEHAVYHADRYLHDGEKLTLAGVEITVLHTPGHTVGGACFYIEEEHILFSGDTLFCESVGRTDFPKGSASALIRSITEKLMKLPDDVIVYTGHNDITTIGHERQYNPFL